MLNIFENAIYVSTIFKLGYVPEKDEYYELTPEQYRKYYREFEDGNDKTDEMVFMLLPKDPQKYNELVDGDVFVLTETEIKGLEKANKVIEKICRECGKTFANYEEKLVYVASKLPAVFSKNTKFAQKDEYFRD
jgi:formylmethanofuran dehydrogenase subunit E